MMVPRRLRLPVAGPCSGWINLRAPASSFGSAASFASAASGEGAAAAGADPTPSAGGRRSGGGPVRRPAGRQWQGPQAAGSNRPVTEDDVEKRMKELQNWSKLSFDQQNMRPTHEARKPSADWRKDPGHNVPYRFRLPTGDDRPKDDRPKDDRQQDQGKEAQAKGKKAGDIENRAYTDHTGLRFPTLETAENYDYHKDRGLDRVAFERSYPIKVPGYRRLDPYLREYIHFLHSLDPVRFTIDRIAERYRLRSRTVAKVVQEWGVNRYLTRSGLTRLSEKQQTRESVILKKKEEQYAKWVGFDQLGDEDDPESDDEALGAFKGWRSTSDWVRRQSVEVEMMSAFPMPEKRDPMPKRVDVDMVVDSRRDVKVINWIDPSDKVVF
mmetsp:Transcript_154193/g.494368  ORF Transcript_154193/g.494368 Transcript_154193/m.494368 type:complete len:382 (-) Transcript_154193:111-1256(-)